MRRALRHHSLGLFFGALFLLSLAGQAFAGWHASNAEQAADGLGTLSFGRYLVSSDFAVDITENWQSEYLQFLLFITATVWLLQRGSPESKELDKAGLESDEDQKVGKYADERSPRWAAVGGIRTTVFSWSLALVMGTIFLVSWLAQSIAGQVAFNEARLGRRQDPLTWTEYVANADFWSRTLQNWQSEFLAVGSMAVLAIYLRQRGSPESKPVGEAHDATGVEG
ncbi:hypothetical protein D0Z08_21925 [Nocardioides immobilis]|uniref:Uncharacterized protein n=1 Tax=Nocardioides immobilis TaxID=2049295 RepID=A0A417XWW4_9ACTN|nr:DUF6766 family protein [Nocardioides immobilis]RHW24866.1 hypothetical protein D0Z08_21925 [Nocardioides immobilis]